MFIIPAIDIKGGKCVRLQQGEADKETIYSDSPLEVAKKWVSMGAERLHVIDLDGAFKGQPVNLETVLAIKKETGVFVQMGGGFRTIEAIDSFVQTPIDRVILGTMVYEAAGDAATALERNQNRILVALDTKNDMVATKGWTDITEIPVNVALSVIEKIGCQEIIFTDTARDGMLKGVNLDSVKKVVATTKMKVIAAGGVTSLEDIESLKKSNVAGCIIGKALYDGRIELKKAIKIAG